MTSRIVLLFALFAVAIAKPVSNKKPVKVTTPAPALDDDGLDNILNAGLMSLGSGATCDSWIDTKMKAMNTNVEDLAKMIVDAEPKELALEFIVFCLMDDQPMSDRPSMLKLAIDEEKQAMTATTTPKPTVKAPVNKNRNGGTKRKL